MVDNLLSGENASAWVQALRPGDLVLVDAGGVFSRTMCEEVVERVTPTGVVRLRGRDEAYDRHGYRKGRRGAGYGARSRLVQWNQADVDAAEASRLVDRLRYIDREAWARLTLVQLRQIVEMLDAAAKPVAPGAVEAASRP